MRLCIFLRVAASWQLVYTRSMRRESLKIADPEWFRLSISHVFDLTDDRLRAFLPLFRLVYSVDTPVGSNQRKPKFRYSRSCASLHQATVWRGYASGRRFCRRGHKYDHEIETIRWYILERFIGPVPLYARVSGLVSTILVGKTRHLTGYL